MISFCRPFLSPVIQKWPAVLVVLISLVFFLPFCRDLEKIVSYHATLVRTDLPCLQGVILDGYPKTVAQARLLFEEGELEAPEEGALDDEEDLPVEEGETKKAEDRWLPDKVWMSTCYPPPLSRHRPHLL